MGARWVPSQWLTVIKRSRAVCAQAWRLAVAQHLRRLHRLCHVHHERIKCDLHRCMTHRNPPCIPHCSHVCLYTPRRNLVGPVNSCS